MQYSQQLSHPKQASFKARWSRHPITRRPTRHLPSWPFPSCRVPPEESLLFEKRQLPLASWGSTDALGQPAGQRYCS